MNKCFFELFLSVYSSLVGFSKKSEKKVKFLLAVSGGSDSVALLHLVYLLRKKLNCEIAVITVNHNIRAHSESRQDVLFVKKMCNLAFAEKIPCAVAEIPTGKIQEIAKKRGKGIEEAARFLRYKVFEASFKFFKADYILTAHTQDDFYEGVLMAFFRGSSPSALLGMQKQRGHYIKPLLNVKKTLLRKYLINNKIQWKEDSTNQSTQYLRNSVRLALIPSIEKTFSGWQSGIAKTLKRLELEEEYINLAYKNFFKANMYWKKRVDGALYTKKDSFIAMPCVFKLRFLQEGFLLLKVSSRISYFGICSLMKVAKEGDSADCGSLHICIESEKVLLSVKKKISDKSALVAKGYMFWVNKPSKILIKNCVLYVEIRDSNAFIRAEGKTEEVGPFRLPLCIRSRLNGDIIKIAGKVKTLKSIFGKSGIPSKLSSILPIIEEGGVVRAVYGKALGAKNLIGDEYS